MRVRPCPQESDGNRYPRPPSQPGPAPERDDQDWEHGVAQDYAPGIGVAHPCGIVKPEDSCNPPLKRHYNYLVAFGDEDCGRKRNRVASDLVHNINHSD